MNTQIRYLIISGPRTRASHRTLACTALLLLAIAAVNVRAMPNYSVVDVVITFAAGENTNDPQFDGVSLKIANASKSTVIADLSVAVEYEALVRDRTAPYFSYDGPWRIAVLTDLSPEDLVADLRMVPQVAQADLALRDDVALSERTAAWFPSEERDLFCPAQLQLHWPRVGDSELPGETCGPHVGDIDHDMDMPQAWAISRGDTGVTVAIIDTGFDLFHPNLGGPGPVVQVNDSLLYYNRGMWYRNWDEVPGDLYNDGYPGEAGVDDDHDGSVDEDAWGLVPGNEPEADIKFGAFTGISGSSTIVDETAHWVQNELQGRRIGLIAHPPQGRRVNWETIEANTATTITTTTSRYLYKLQNGWSDVATLTGYAGYVVCNGVDDDADGVIDDLGYTSMPNDDDENGYEDDFRGWDFYNNPSITASRCEKEDYVDEDNDARGFWDHGTSVASQVANADVLGQMMGVAPHVRVMPLRVGATYSCGPRPPVVDTSLFDRAIRYAIGKGADVISVSMAPWTIPIEAVQAALAAGIVVVWGAGNWPEPPPAGAYMCPDVVFAAGLDLWDQRYVHYYNGQIDSQSNYGWWVDVSALGMGVTEAVWGMDPLGRDESGNPVPWLSPEEWHSYGYDWNYGVTHTAGGGWGTSLSTPIVAGVVALLKSVYPHWSRQEIVSKLKQGVDDISAANPSLPNQLGTGRVNAHRALTFYGDIPASSDTTWAHNIWIGGAIHVPGGHSLAIAAGDTVRVAVDDLLSPNTKEIEFAIDGELHVNGTPSAPVVFESFGGSYPRWLVSSEVVISGETFTIGGLGCAQIASAARSPLMPGVSAATQVFSIDIAPVAALDSVKVDLTGLGLSGSNIRLSDNGQGEDIAASDGIYTSEPFAAVLAAGNGYSVDVTAYATGGGYTRRSVAVEVPSVVAKFTDVSAQTGLNYLGTPYSAASGKYGSAYEMGLMVVPSDAYAEAYDRYYVLPSGAPGFSSVLFNVPLQGLRGVSRADYDNDGDEDLFVAHGQTPKLYRNDAGAFVDVTSAMGLSTLTAGSTAPCWGDYDNDGWLDLFVARCDLTGPEPPDVHSTWGAPQRLFRNTLGVGGGFVDVSTSAGLQSGPGSVAASWGDLDNDGDLDLFALSFADPPMHEPALWVNQGDGTFLNEFMTRMYYVGSTYFGYGDGVVWADMNNDGYFDLVVSCAEAGSRVLLNDGQGLFPSSLAIPLPASAGSVGSHFNGVQVLDHNLDGWQDILLLSRNQDEPSRLFLAKPTQDGIEYVENTHNAALAHTSNGMGSLAADYTSDGDMDLFIGRPVASGEFFYKTDDQSGANSLGQRYVKVRLVSPTNDVVNRQAIGAAVSVTAGSLVQTQLVDGGSGRGGQRDRTLTFGLGDYTGPVSATIGWPGGTQSEVDLIVSGAGTAETVNIVSDAAPAISNVNVASLVVPGTTFFDWVFSWDTDVACKTANDVLTFDQQGINNPCWPGWTTVTPASPGITYTYAAKSGGGYTHTVRIDHEDCNLGCSFRYTVTSDSGLHQDSSPTKTKTVKFCPSGF